MGKVVTVTEILDPAINSGGSGQKAWSQSEVKAEGLEHPIRVFNPVQVGDKFESYQKGKYWNYKKVEDEAPQAPAPAPAPQPTPAATPAPKKETKTATDWANKDAEIKAQWAIGRATELCGAGQIKFDDIEAVAFEFYDMVDRVKLGLDNHIAKGQSAVEPAQEILGGEEVDLV